MPAVGRSKAEAWLRCRSSSRGSRSSPDVPVVAAPLDAGAIGVCGPRGHALEAARSLVVQAVALHSPAEVAVCAFASSSTSRDWDFLKWLPHTSSPHSPVDAGHLAQTAPGCSALADALEDLVAGKAGGRVPGQADAPAAAGSGGPERPTVLVLVESDAPIDRSRLVSIAERGHRKGSSLCGSPRPSAAAGGLPHLPRRRRRPRRLRLARRLRPPRRGGPATLRRPDRLRRGDGVRQTARAGRRRRRAGRGRERPAPCGVAAHPDRHRAGALGRGSRRAVVRVALDPQRALCASRAAAQAGYPARRRRDSRASPFSLDLRAARPARPRRRHHRRRQVRVPAGLDPRPGGRAQPRSGSRSCSSTTRAAPRSATASTCRTPSAWSPTSRPPGPAGARLAERRAAPPRAPAAPGTRPRTSSSWSAGASPRRRRACSSSSTSSPRWSRRCPSSSTASSTSPSAAARSACT